jgi:hypothetical protein
LPVDSENPDKQNEQESPGTVDILIEKFDLPHLMIYQFNNLGEHHIQIGNLLPTSLPSDLECYGPYEVNNVDPWAIVNANSDEILLFKYNNKIAVPNQI